MEGLEDYQSLHQAVSTRLISTTQSARQLAAEDLEFLRTSDKKAGKKVDRKNKQLLGLAQELILSSTAGTSITIPELKKPASIQENWRTIADVLDNLLERADRCLDEYTGVITKLSKEKEAKIQDGLSSRKDGRGSRSHPLEKPQLLFKKIPKNDETTPFKPLLTSKPHAVTSLEKSLEFVKSEDGKGSYKHPYEREITESSYPASVYLKTEPIPAIDDPEAKTLTWVDTPKKVAEMLKDLKEAKEIAVDLEHHDTHSYVGLVCLMQISTRQKDWIVDTLKPWREELQVLNEVFADPKILKVFHGSTMDIIWLQRDLGLYVVGLFDTYHATVALQYPRHSLAFLLKRFENFDAQKQYQMADWRVRPLNNDLMQYARSDTHYLLHVYDCVRNELLEQSSDEDLVGYVLKNSKEEALQQFERSFYDAELGRGSYGWLGLLMKTPARLNKQQFAVFRAVHQFRDQVARRTDESLLVVMRHDTIFAIARTMPEDMPALLSVMQPVSPFVQPKLSELLGVIRKAKASGENGPTIEEIMEKPELQNQSGVSRYLKKAMKAANNSDVKSSTPKLTEVIRSEREKMVEEAPEVASKSVFWGPILDQNSSQPATKCEVRLDVPVPKIGKEQPATLNGASKKVKKDTTAGTEEEAPSRPPKAASAKPKDLETEQATTFSIKELKKQNRKRKAEQAALDQKTNEINEDESNTGEPVEIEEQSPEKKEQKKSKAEKKAAKKAKKELAKQTQEEVEPFDYANAANAPEDSAKGVKAKKQKVYDPYAKALDAPKGLPRRSGGKAGKSKTFKS